MQLSISRPLPADVEALWLLISQYQDRMYAPPASRHALVTGWGTDLCLFTGCIGDVVACWFILHAPTSSGAAWDETSVTFVCLPSYRGKVALALVTLGLSYCALWSFHTLHTWCLHENQAAKRFARRCGFVPSAADARGQRYTLVLTYKEVARAS